VVRRGLARRCPRCGRGELFSRLLKVHPNCSVCGLALAPRPGDTWGFWVLGDRIFLFVPVVLIYFSLAPPALIWRIALIVVLLVPFLATMPHRLGVCIGLDYLSRSRWGDWQGQGGASRPEEGDEVKGSDDGRI
jgi:uncharacterized protein (DUF983 family)